MYLAIGFNTRWITNLHHSPFYICKYITFNIISEDQGWLCWQRS